MDVVLCIISSVLTANALISFIKYICNKLNKSSKNGNLNMEQIVYKIEKGDLVGDIKGDNIIVILMNGDVNGDISSKEGDVVLIKGDINGDVKANKIICPQQKSEYENYIDKLSGIDKLSKPDKEDNEIHCVCAKPNTNCAKCAWYDYVEQECKSWNVNEGECHFIDKNEMEKRHDDFVKNFKNFRQTAQLLDYVDCADCIYAQKCNGGFMCFKFNGSITRGGSRVCNSFEQKEHHTCKSCYHFVKSSMCEETYYCSKDDLEILTDTNSCCQYYDGTGETTKHKIDCARATNNTGRCLFFYVFGCPIQNNCPYKIERKD